MPRPDRIREWTYQAITRGAECDLLLQVAPVQVRHGAIRHGTATTTAPPTAGTPRSSSLERNWRARGLIQGTNVRAEVAFLHDYDSRIALSYQKSNAAMSYMDTLLGIYRGLFANNIAVDILSKDWDLAGYALVVAPAHFVLTETRARMLREYVKGGGTLVMTYRSAVKDATNLIFDQPLPGLLQDAFGIEVKEYHSPAANEENMIWGVMGDIQGY